MRAVCEDGSVVDEEEDACYDISVRILNAIQQEGLHMHQNGKRMTNKMFRGGSF